MDRALIKELDRSPPRVLRRDLVRPSECHHREWTNKMLVGSGSFGKVYQTCCEGDCRYVVKSCLTERELAINLVAALHDVVPPVYDHWFDDDDCVHLVSEKMRYTLEFLPNMAYIPTIFNVLLDKLETLHDMHVTHGDIKMDNIMVSDDNVPYFIDLGLSSIHPGPDEYFEKQKQDDIIRLSTIAQRFSEHFTDDDFDIGLSEHNYMDFYLRFS